MVLPRESASFYVIRGQRELLVNLLGKNHLPLTTKKPLNRQRLGTCPRRIAVCSCKLMR